MMARAGSVVKRGLPELRQGPWDLGGIYERGLFWQPRKGPHTEGHRTEQRPTKRSLQATFRDGCRQSGISNCLAVKRAAAFNLNGKQAG
jgi:hypothetical protein